MGSCVDEELWRACAGVTVNVPLVNSEVMYIPQGHAEQAKGTVNFDAYLEIPAFVKCRVASVKYMANLETDDVYLRMTLMPVRIDEGFMEFDNDDLVGDGLRKCSSFTKILTQSDANNGGGFSVPRQCADSLFPELDYSADPPVQNLFIKDVHGVVWKFRHIFRGTPRRHLLTTGWSNFVNDKKLVAGDSVIFLKSSNGELCIGIRRAKRGISRVTRVKSKCGPWESPHGEFRSVFGNGSKGGHMSIISPRKNGKVSVETVLEAVQRAAAGKEFEVDYYPRAGFPEFCVKSSVVRSAMSIRWCAGMKFKMAVESEDASKDNWFVGTIQAVQAAEPGRWPTSPWRMLKVTWDEPSLNYVERVSPWSIDIAVGGMMNMHPVSLSPPMKRLRLGEQPELPSHSQHPPPFPDPFIPNLSYHPVVSDKALTGIQGARHVQQGQFPMNLHLNIPPTPHFHPHFNQPFTSPMPTLAGANFRAHQRKEGGSRLWKPEMTPITPKKVQETDPNAIFLFGQRIEVEKKVSPSSSAATPVSDSIITSDRNMDKVKSGTERSESGSVQDGKECTSDGRSSAEIVMDPQTSGASQS